MKRTLIGLVVLVVTIGVLALCMAALIRKPGASLASGSSTATLGTSKSDCNGVEEKPVGRYLGFASAASVADTLSAFTNVTGFKPTVTQMYVRFGAPFPTAAACKIAADGALPVIQINPQDVSLAKIAYSKQWTKYLKAYGEAIRAFGKPVAIGFAHEADGSWYTWGCSHTSPRVFVAAWRSVYRGINAADPHNVKWVWTVSNRYEKAECSLKSLWPGGKYVTWVGVDGYLRTASNTFSSSFGPILSYSKRYFHKPVLITESGVNSGPFQAVQITALLQHAYSYPGILGLIYFDSKTVISDYRPQRNAATLAAFRRAAAAYFRPKS